MEPLGLAARGEPPALRIRVPMAAATTPYGFTERLTTPPPPAFWLHKIRVEIEQGFHQFVVHVGEG